MHIQSNELASYINDLDDLQTKTYLFEIANSLFINNLQAIEDFKIRLAASIEREHLKEKHKNSNIVFPEF